VRQRIHDDKKTQDRGLLVTRGDLHIHTRLSDGSYEYREALLLARQQGLSYLAFTDHDTVDGLAEAFDLGCELGVTVIPGVEISAWDKVRGRKVHILGYGFGLDAPHIRALCAPLPAARHANTLRQLEAVRAAGYPVYLADVERAARGSKYLHKQHIMQALIDAGIADTHYGELYRALFKADGIAAFDMDYPDALDAVRAVNADGGIAVLAHPGEYDSWDLVPELVEAGLGGIEYLHESHRTEDHRKVLALARRYSLLLAGGSDDHGSLGSSVHLGDLCPPADIPMALLARDHPAMAAALPLVMKAGARLREAAAETGATETKGGDHRDLVTKWDRAIESFIVSGLSAAFPGSRFITEEQADGEGWPGDALPPGPVWILDPIDGTTNFAETGRGYAVSLALYEDGRPELALVLDCERNRLYSAVAGKGAKVDGRSIRRTPRTPVESAHPLRDALVDISLNSVEYLAALGGDAGYLNREMLGHRACGSAALGICQVAEGTLGAYVSGKLCIWDWAAAHLVLTESGGIAWEGPVREAANGATRGVAKGEAKGESPGIRAKRFYMAASSEPLGEELIKTLCSGEYREGIRRLRAP
jgi:fructose-1,6-bisphosphatase/inositol monophosphatase family enzyme/predicted metal-dependent phosphoesterase TrpH